MTRQESTIYIKADRINYYAFFSKAYWMDWLLHSEQYCIRCYLLALRREEYYTIHRPVRLLKYFYRRKKNVWGQKLGFFMHAGNFGLGLKIYHYGRIIVHPKARIGQNCTIHGDCCIGSKGTYPDLAPRIGNNVDIGQGAQVLGNICIADGVIIGAGAIVTKSVTEPDVTIAGVPAKIIRK